MVKLLPSDVARLVLAYLQGNNLKNASQKFLEESPHLEEVRKNPECPALLPLAKDLETILDEHATFIHDGKKRTQMNPVVIQLWRKLDAVVAQLKYEYLQETLPPPQMKGVNNYLHNQRVRSRLSLNALRSQQKHGIGQTNLGESSASANSPRESSDGRTLPRNLDQNSPESPEGTDGALTQQAITSSQECRSDTTQELPDACQPSTSGTQRDPVRSPKRKSITPRKKYSPEDQIPMRHKTASQEPTTSAPTLYPEELIEFPQILESLLSDQTLPERLAGTINKVLPNTELVDNSIKTQASITTTVSPSLRTVDEGSAMDRRALEEVIEMASSDPAFDSLFSLFNVDRENFLEEEKKRLIAQPSTSVPRQLFQLELREKQVDPLSQKDVMSSNGMQAKTSNERQAESSKEKLTHKAEENEAKEPAEESNQKMDEDSCDGEAQGDGDDDDEIVEMETENISTSPAAAQVEKVEVDSSYIDVETNERDSPTPLEETSHQSEEEVDVTEVEGPDPTEGHLSEEEVDVAELDRSEPKEGHLSEEEVDVAELDRSDPKEGHLSEEEVDVTELDRSDPKEGHLSEEEVDVTEVEEPDPTEGHLSEEEVDVAELDRSDPKEGHLSEEEVDVTELDRSDPKDGQLSEEEVDVMELGGSDPAEGDMSGKNAAQRLSNAAQEKNLQQSKGVSEGSNASQNQIVTEEEQKDDEASTGDKGKKVIRRRRRDRTTGSQGTRRSRRLEEKKKEISVPDGSPCSNHGEGEETPVTSPAKSKISVTESNLMDRANTPNLEAANEYAKKVLASMAHEALNNSPTGDGLKTVTTNVIVTTGDNQSISSSNLYSQSDVSSMVTSSGGKKCMTVASLTNTTATVLSTRQNAQITTTKSLTSKGKVTVMAPPGAYYSNGSLGVSRKDTSNIRALTGSGKSEKKISEGAQPQSMAANLKTSSSGSIGMEIESGANSRVQVTSNSSTSLETNVSKSSGQTATGFIDNNGNLYHGTPQNAIGNATSVQGAIRATYMSPATSVSNMNNAYSISKNVQAHQNVTSLATNNATNATATHLITAAMDTPQNTQGLQSATQLDTNVRHLSENQFIPASVTQNMQPQQQAVGLAANTQNTSTVQYIPVSLQAGENPTANMQAASNVSTGNISREHYGQGSNTSYSIAGARTSTLPLLVYNPAALQSTNVVPGSVNLQSSGNQGSMNVVFIPVENNNNRTFQVLQSNPGSSGMSVNPQVITLQAADGLLSLSGAVQNVMPSSEIEQTKAIPQQASGSKANGSKANRKASRMTTSRSKEVNSMVGHSNMDTSGNLKSAVPLNSPNILPSAQHQALIHGPTVAHNQGLDAKRSVAQEVQKKSSGLDGSDVVPQRQASASNLLNLDNQGVATLINEELERSLENASTQDIDFIFKAITMTPQKEPVPSDCAKYSPLDKAIADKLKRFSVSASNQGSSTEVPKRGQPSPLKKAAMQMQGDMLRNKKCVRKVFSEEGSFDERPLKDTRTETAERTANIADETDSGNRTIDHSREQKFVLESSQIMNGFVPTGTLPTNHVRSHSHALHTSLPDALGPVKVTPSSESEKRRNKSESYESSRQSEGHQIRQDRNAQSAKERQHPSHQNSMDHYSQSVSKGLQENTTVPKCNKDRTQKMEERLKQKDFKYRIDVEKKQKLEKRMRTRLKNENLEMQTGKGLENKDKNRMHEGTDLRTSENSSISNSNRSEEVAEKIVNERGTSVNGGRGDSEGRKVKRSAHEGRENSFTERGGDDHLHGHGSSGGIRIGNRGGERVNHPGREASGFERRRDEELMKKTSGHGKEPTGHHTLSNVRDGRMPGVLERTSKEGDDGGDNLWSRLEKVTNKRVEEREEQNSEKNSSRKVGEMNRKETDSLQHEESCSRTEGYNWTAKRGTPESKMRLAVSGGIVSDNERVQEMEDAGRRNELANEENFRENENIQNMKLREPEGSESVGVHQERTNGEILRENYHTGGNLHVSGRSPNLEEGMKDTNCGEQVYGAKVGESNNCSTPKEKSEETAMSGQVETEYSSSTQGRLRGESLQNVTEKGSVENGACIENLDQSDKVHEQQFQNENLRRMMEHHEEPNVSPILADEDVSSIGEDDSCTEEIDSCSRTRVHYSKTNFKWNKPRAESSRISVSSDGKTLEPKYHSPQSLVNGPSPISLSRLNNRTHSVDDHVKESTRLVKSHSNHSQAGNQSLPARLQASGREGSIDALAGPSRVAVPGPSSGREDKTKRTSIKATKRPSEDDKNPNQEKKKRKKKKSIGDDDFPTDFDLQKFFAKLKYA